MFGDSFEPEALDKLWQLRSKLSATERVTLLNELLQLESQRPRWEDRVARQRILDENANWHRHMQSMLEQWSGRRARYDHRSDYYQWRQTQMCVLLADLALREFQSKHGRLPETLEELVPEHLPALPPDPFAAGQPILYRLEGSTYRLYSVGLNGVDDGGHPQTRGARQLLPDYTDAALFPTPANSPPATPTSSADTKKGD
jgi:hypothetical protein